MKFLVTGATGFLGSWLVKKLVEEKHDVRVLRRKSSDISDLTEFKIEHYLGDVTDKESVIKACAGVDAVFHLAALIAYSKKDRAAMEEINVQGTANVIAACEAQHVKRLVYLSSVAAIGASFDGKTPLNENSEYNIGHLDLGYFETKRAAEKLVRAAVQQGRIDAVILNPSTIYGPGDSKKGSRKVQLKVAQGKFPVYPPGGVNVVHVEDVVDGIYSAWSMGKTGERYILAGENILIKDLFKTIAGEAHVSPPQLPLTKPVLLTLAKIGDVLETYGKKFPMTTENAWSSILYHWFDSSKAQKNLTFKPRPAVMAIHDSVAWSQKQGLC